MPTPQILPTKGPRGPEPSPEQEITTPAALTPEAQPTDAAGPSLSPVEAEAVWIADREGLSLLRVDPAANTVAARLPLEGVPGALAVGEGAVWVVLEGEAGADGLAQIDPGAEAQVDPIDLENAGIFSLAAGEGAVWAGAMLPLAAVEPAGGEQPDGPAGDDLPPMGAPEDELPEGIDFAAAGGVFRIDPAKNKSDGFVPLDSLVDQVFVANGSVWAGVSGMGYGQLVRIDPQDLSWEVVHEFYDFAPGLAFGAGSVWTVPLGVSALSNVIERLDLETGETQARIDGGSEPVARLVYAGEALWVAYGNGRIGRLDPRANRLTPAVETGSPLEDLFAASGSLWAVSQEDRKLFRIDPQNGEIVAAIPF